MQLLQPPVLPQSPPGISGLEEAGSLKGATDSSVSAARLEELTCHVRANIQETREATTTLRRALDNQQRQYHRLLSDFQMKMEETARRKSNVASQRVEIAPESLQLLRAMLVPVHSGTAVTNGSSSVVGNMSTDSIRHWFAEVEGQLHRLLLAAGSKAEARKHLQTISLIVHNLVTNPTDDKYREVNSASARLREILGSQGPSNGGNGMAELLRLAGFDNSRDGAFLFPAGQNLDAAERVRDILQDALRDCDKRWEQAQCQGPEATVNTAGEASSAGATGGNGGSCAGTSNVRAMGASCPPPAVSSAAG